MNFLDFLCKSVSILGSQEVWLRGMAFLNYLGEIGMGDNNHTNLLNCYIILPYNIWYINMVQTQAYD